MFPRSRVIEMLKFEQKLRYSPEIQKIYSHLYTQRNNFRIETEIQKYVLTHFGYQETDLEEYWKIPKLYWEDEEVKNSIFYMKLNIFSYGNLKVGDKMVDVPLYDYVSTKEINLSNLETPGRPLVILAGSMT